MAPRRGPGPSRAGRAPFDELRDRFDLVVQVIDRRRELHLAHQQAEAATGLHQSVVSRGEAPSASAASMCGRRSPASGSQSAQSVGKHPVVYTQHMIEVREADEYRRWSEGL